MSRVFASYRFNKPGNVYNLEDPIKLEQTNVEKEILERVRKEPNKKFVIVYLVAGHGIVEQG